MIILENKVFENTVGAEAALSILALVGESSIGTVRHFTIVTSPD